MPENKGVPLQGSQEDKPFPGRRLHLGVRCAFCLLCLFEIGSRVDELVLELGLCLRPGFTPANAGMTGTSLYAQPEIQGF
jgi:hypothetical protein